MRGFNRLLPWRQPSVSTPGLGRVARWLLVFIGIGSFCSCQNMMSSDQFYEQKGLGLTKFQLSPSGVDARIVNDTSTIAFHVPWSDVSSEIPAISTNGASIEPASGVVQNFFQPISYTVTASNGTTHVYRVQTTLGSSVRTVPVNDYWRSSAFGNGRFVSLGSFGNSISSLDGDSWQSGTLPNHSLAWGALGFGNGLFVAIQAQGHTATSPDGVNWTTAGTLAPYSGSWPSIAFGDGLFVAVNDGNSNSINTINTSTDGKNWSTRTLPVYGKWSSVSFGNGRFVAVSQDNKSVTSTDGTNWSGGVLPTALWWEGIAYGASRFAALSSDGKVGISTDGANWSLQAMPKTNAVNQRWSAIAFGNGVFVVVGSGSSGSDQAWISPDGATWYSTKVPVIQHWESITWGNGKFLVGSGGSNQVVTSP